MDDPMSFWSGIKYTYREGWAFLLACPLLALVPVAFELLQHVVEMQIGMYDSIENATAADADGTRMAFGYAKTLGMLLPGYWVIRFLAGNRDAGSARTYEPAAARLFALVFGFQAILNAFLLFGLPRTGTGLLIAMTLGLAITPLLSRWSVAAPLGVFIPPLQSVRAMAPQLPWALAFSIVVILPLMIPHYALGTAAIFAPAALKWPVLIIDSMLVGCLAVVMVASTWAIATRKAPLA